MVILDEKQYAKYKEKMLEGNQDIDISQLNKEDKYVNRFINKAIILGLKIREFETECKHKYYIIDIDNETHTICIPSDVRLIKNTFSGLVLPEDPIRALRGSVRVIGGESLLGLDFVFENCILNTLDLTGLRPTGYITVNNIFGYSKIDNIIFNKNNIWKITQMTRAFEGGTFGSLDLSNWNVSLVKDLNWVFYKSTIKQLNISSWNLSNIKYLNFTFNRMEIDTLDIRNLILSNTKSTSKVFGEHKIKNIMINELDRNWKTKYDDLTQMQ